MIVGATIGGSCSTAGGPLGLELEDPDRIVAAEIQGAPPAMDSVTVLDVLRQLGGFLAGPASYAQHSLIDASVYGEIPISGEELFDYVVGGAPGHRGERQLLGCQVVHREPVKKADRLLKSGVLHAWRTRSGSFGGGLSQDIFSDPAHRLHARGVTLAGKRAYLVNSGHPYHTKPPQDAQEAGDCGVSPQGWAWNGAECKFLWSCDCSGSDCGNLYTTSVDCKNDHLSPQFGWQALPQSSNGDGSIWRDNAGPIDAKPPERSSWSRYAGGFFMGGAPLAAGGWHGDGVSLGLLIRALAQSDDPMWSVLWSPQWWNLNNSPDPNWSYGLGWYVRGNWVAWAGGAEGSMATVLHNRAYDFTIVHLSNVAGNGLSEFMNPLMQPVLQGWDTSPVGSAFPCLDDPQTATSECSGQTTAPY